MTSSHEAILLTPALLESQPDILPGIARLHASCILTDGTLATFVPPLDASTITEWWKSRWAECLRGEREIIIILNHNAESTLTSSSSTTSDSTTTTITINHSNVPQIDDNDKKSILDILPSSISGVVSLGTPFSQTGPHRGLVEKFFVSPTHRRLGLGRLLMAKLEAVALQRGRTNLFLDTTVGTPAEHVYPRLGYRRLGVVERYGYHPLTGELVDEVFFWKDLTFDPICS